MKRLRALIFILAAALLLSHLCAYAAPAPVLMANRTLGGAQLNANTPGVTGGSGTNNIGLLVKTWGKVTYIDTTAKFFYIDDGSHLNDQSGITGATGMRVSYKDLAPGSTFTPPSTTGGLVTVVGISSTTALTVGQTTRIAPTLRPRKQADLAPLP